MPELPEVETIKNYLKKALIGKEIVGFDNLDKKRVRIKEKDVVGKKILDIERRGKILIFKLSNNKEIFIHLKMSGQLIFQQNKEISKFARAIFKFRMQAIVNNIQVRNGDKFYKSLFSPLSPGLNSQPYIYLTFNDTRRFGWMKLKSKEAEKLGIEPFSKEFNLRNLEKIFSQTKRPIKIILMDQTKIAGIGNIYANESLFLAKINPQKPANKLTKKEIKRLKKSILRVLNRALKYEGTTSKFYIKPDQSKGKYQEKFLAYQRENERCFRCKRKIEKIILGGRSTFYCLNCQK